ncbi:MAG TPA: HIT family protein [bacterium]|nr:HIT family protein [bacterium]
MMECIFCRIVAGELPCYKVYEDADALAFMDINPLAAGHVLVVPKTHCVNLFDVEEPVLRHTIAAVRKVARALKRCLDLDSMNLVQANGPWALQSVPHLHFHLVPRHKDDGVPLDWNLNPGDKNVIRALGEKLAAAVAQG